MIRTRFNHGWQRRGFALLWDPDLLADIVQADKIVTIRDFFSMLDCWPDDLPGSNGNALVVTGLEGTIDILDGQEADIWIEEDLRQAILSFQDYYEGGAGLIFWTPSGRGRISMNGATERYYWRHRPSGNQGLPIGRLLFSGAENEVERILNTDNQNADYDGKAWAGLCHPRIS